MRRKGDSATMPVRNGFLIATSDQRSNSGAASKPDTFPMPEQRIAEAVLEAWRQKLGLRKIVLVGHSLGGCIAFNYAERHPDAIARLVLCSPCGVPHRPDSCGIAEQDYQCEEPHVKGTAMVLAVILDRMFRQSVNDQLLPRYAP
eukprot:6470802-Amphidinium_carterae.2